MWGGVNSAYADDAEGWNGKYIKSVSEAITSLDNLQDGFYLFRQNGKKRFLYENRAENGGIISTTGDGPYDYKEGQLLIRKVDNSAADVASFKSSFEGVSKDMLSYVVRVTKNTDGTFKMQFRSGKYMPNALNVGWAADDQGGNGDDRRVFTTEEVGAIEFTYISDTYFKFKGQGGDLYGEGWEGNDGVNGKFCGAADGGDIKYEIFPVTLADPQPISCTFTAQDADGNVLATKTQDVGEGDQATNPFDEYSYFYTPEFVESDLVASETNKDFHVKFTESNVPFQFSTADAPVWYTIHFRKTDENKYLRHVNAADEKISTTAFSDNNGYPSFCGGLWAFVRDGLGVKLLCKQTGTYVTVDNANNGQAAKLDANGMAFIVKTNSCDPNASKPSVSSTGFSLKYPGVDKAYLGDHASGLGIWTPAESWADSQNDAGSCYQIALADVNDIVNIGIASFNHNTPNATQGNFLTAGCNDADVQAAKEAAQSATTLAQLDAAYEKLCYAYPEANAYYRIKNVSTSEYVHTDNVEVGTDGNLANNVDVERSASSTTNLVGQLWQFEADGNGKYYVKNANSGRYFSNEAEKHIYLATEANEATAKGSFTFKAFPSVNSEDTNIKLQLRLNDENRINAYQGTYNKYLQNWDGGDNPDGDQGSYWTFEKVTSITVKIGETGWTSVCYPFAVTIPAESTVKAYYAEKTTTDGLQLNEVEGNVIPANQGVFLVNVDGTTDVNLEITNDANATLDNNLLSGATAKRTGFTANDTYLLGLSSSDSPALLKSTLTWVPANKAYFLASKLANGNVLSLTFGQNTGIGEAAATADQSETYYDLNGRVVLYPQHGIFVTKSGRKVYVK